MINIYGMDIYERFSFEKIYLLSNKEKKRIYLWYGSLLQILNAL